MAKEFNTEGSCNPELHYMVDITDKLNDITKLIDKGKYFTINRARQFGKTTTMKQLAKKLQNDYIVIPISFEGVGGLLYKDETSFCTKFKEIITNKIRHTELKKVLELWEKTIKTDSLDLLSDSITNFCPLVNKKVVVMIDEVDKSTDNQLFLHFLGMLRNKYLDRDELGMNSTFHSVILAGVYDVKNLKLKIRSDEERKYNSPWNIAADFLVDMTFKPLEIKGMLDDYEKDFKTGMDTQTIAEEIYKYTSGYPFLVSKICQIIDLYLDKEWNLNGIKKAVKRIEGDDDCTLINDITKNLENDKELKDLMKAILVENFNIEFNANNPILKRCKMFSLLKADNEGFAIPHNIVFQRVIYDYFITEEKIKNRIINSNRSEYILDGKLNMPYVIERFKDLMYEEYRKENGKFIEREARLLFLCFLKPIINGTGFYYVEPQTRDNRRMDIVVTYAGEEFIIELKMWYGRKYEQNGKVQLAEYLTSKKRDKGYLVTFSFLKEKANQAEPEWVEQDGKQIYEAIIDVNVSE